MELLYSNLTCEPHKQIIIFWWTSYKYGNRLD